MSYLNQVDPILLYDFHPNPISGILYIKFENLNAGSYHLSIYNILGIEAFNNRYMINNQILEDKINISTFPSGPYVYQLMNDKQQVVATGQFIISTL